MMLNSGTNKKALWNLLMEDFDDYLNIMNNWSYLGSMNRISAFTQFDYAVYVHMKNQFSKYTSI